MIFFTAISLSKAWAIDPALSLLNPNYDQDKDASLKEAERQKKWNSFKEINCSEKPDKEKLTHKATSEVEIFKLSKGSITKDPSNKLTLKFKSGGSLEFKNISNSTKDLSSETSKVFISNYWNQLNYTEIVHLEKDGNYMELIDMNSGIGLVLELGQLHWSPNGEYLVNVVSRNESKSPQDSDKITIYTCKDRTKSCQKIVSEAIEDSPSNLSWTCENKFKTSINECKCSIEECACRNHPKKEVTITTGSPVWANGDVSEQKPSTVTRPITKENPFLILPNLAKIDFSKMPSIFGKSASLSLIIDNEINKKATEMGSVLRTDLSDPRIIQIIIPMVLDPDTSIPITIYAPELAKKQTEDRQAMLYTYNLGEFKANFVEFDEEKNTYYALIKNCSDQNNNQKFGQSICSMKMGLMKVMQISD